MTDQYPVWVLLDDRAGNRSQALGVAGAVNVPFTEKILEYGPAASLPNMLLGASLRGLTSESKKRIQPAWPALVVSAGRRTAPVARWIKSQSGGTTRLVQIMDPGQGRDDFDLLCLPAHDQPTPSANGFVIAAAPHGMTDARLDAAANEWAEKLPDSSGPRIALMIGGSTRRRKFSDDMARELSASALRVAESVNGHLMVTTSRRTGEAVNTIEKTLDGRAMLYRWDSTDENPYAGYLALADAIIVTGESVSMCSEACATGKPVYIYAPDDLITPKHARLHETLFKGEHAKPFDDSVDVNWQPNRLNVADDIAHEIRHRGLLTVDG